MAQTESSTATQPVKLINTLSPNEITDQFKLNQGKFAQLADEQDFASLKDGLIEIDITALLENLDDGGYFEVTLPITGMTDFLAQEGLYPDMPQQFPSVMAINGFGASGEAGAFHKPYFIMVKDIVGNEYEVLVTQSGQIEVPEQGVGLFSMLQSMTFIYSKEQILEGSGLANLESVGAHEGMLYLLPPPGLEAGFTPKVGISYLDDFMQRYVEFEMKVPIEAYLPEMETNTNVEVKQVSDTLDMLHLDISGKKNPFKPVKLHVEMESFQDVSYKTDAQQPNQAWSSLDANTFEASLGISQFAKFAVLRDLLSEFDFTKSLLADNDWGIAHTNGFNDFGLVSEAIGPYYDLLIDMVVQGKADGDFLLSHIPEENFAHFDLSHVAFDADDQSVIDGLSDSISNQDFQGLHDVLSPTSEFNHELVLQVDGTLSQMPSVQAELLDFDATPLPWTMTADDFTIPDNLEAVAAEFSVEPASDFIELPASGSIFASEYEAPVSLASNHEPTTIHYQDIMDFSDSGDVIKGFDMQTDQIDLSGLLETMPGVSEDNVVVEKHGQDVQVGIQGLGEEVMPVATLLGAGGADLPDDLSHIISNPDMS